MIHNRFFRFLLAGGIAALANFGSRIALGLVLPYVVSITIAYGIGMLTAFLLNRRFVFNGAANPVHHQAFWFVMVNLTALLQTILVSVCFARWIFPAVGMSFHPETVAHAIGVVVPVFTSYIGHKRLTFRRAPKQG